MVRFPNTLTYQPVTVTYRDGRNIITPNGSPVAFSGRIVKYNASHKVDPDSDLAGITHKCYTKEVLSLEKGLKLTDETGRSFELLLTENFQLGTTLWMAFT